MPNRTLCIQGSCANRVINFRQSLRHEKRVRSKVAVFPNYIPVMLDVAHVRSVFIDVMGRQMILFIS